MTPTWISTARITAAFFSALLALTDAAAQTQPPQPPTPAASKPERPDEARASGVFGPLRIGPMVGVGVPNLVSFGLTAKLTRYFGFGFNVGIIPTVKVSLYGEAKLSYQEYDAYARVYPFGGGVFLGSGVGYESMRGTFTQSVDIPEIAGVMAAQRLSVQSQATVKSMIVTPQIGYLHTFGSGFSLGVDVGAQIPIAASDISFGATIPPGVPEEYTTSATTQIKSTLQRVGQQVVPTLNLRMAWLF